ncbi:glyoxal oxidase [Microsporum canis CBS 113480]|uniref:Glyoxal oxidase n=1 Tax=Arthroderma otae (strain ATCC MYA-4605 / CBS 113480) TaxID=554155 RepID=C5FZ85_ARTOC|nr:glyoxal oxidase [Microsporum canis CBS 113480]EEQ35188.1 glyoxal oxidase [Microsporum canis CBS 113480]
MKTVLKTTTRFKTIIVQGRYHTMMRRFLLALLVCTAEAHIVFKHAPLSCDPILPAFQGCLRGQRCSRYGQCESSHRPEDEIQPPQSMPSGRVMVEGTLLPDGTIVWLNGCNRGAQGFGIAKDPVYDPWIYNPHASHVERWAVGGSSSIARMYHSVALLLLDGTVMVAGSNPVEQPVLVPNLKDPKTAYVTEFRVEIYTPHYLSGNKATQRPFDVILSSRHLVSNGGIFTIKFSVHKEAIDLHIVLYQGGFVTHSLHMGHRMLYLDYKGWKAGEIDQVIDVTMPPDSNVAPPGAYVVYVVVDGVPSMGQFVMVGNPVQSDKGKHGDKVSATEADAQEEQKSKQSEKDKVGKNIVGPKDDQKIGNGPKDDKGKGEKADEIGDKKATGDKESQDKDKQGDDGKEDGEKDEQESKGEPK